MSNINNILVSHALDIENVDLSIYNWVDNELNIFCNTGDGFKKVPVLWVTPERAFQIKSNKEIRDERGSLNLPLISIERSSIVKDEKNNGVFYAALPTEKDNILIGKRINQKKTSEYANADLNKINSGVNFISPKRKNEKIVYKFYTKKAPVYVNFSYSITLTSQFQQQMNDMVQPFVAKTGRNRYFVLKSENSIYECFIQPNFSLKNSVNSMDMEERRYTTTIEVKVNALFTSSGINEEDTIIKEYENAVEIKLNKDEELVKITNPSNYKEVSSEILNKKGFIIGDGTNSKYTIKHDLNTQILDVKVQKNFDDYSIVDAEIIFVDDNYITIDTKNPIQTNAYKVTIIG